VGARSLVASGIAGAARGAFAAEWGIPRAPTARLAELVADAEVEAVHGCTPPDRRGRGRRARPRRRQARPAREADGPHCRRADEIAQICERAGIRLACMFQNRFTPLARTVRAAVGEGRLRAAVCWVTLSAKCTGPRTLLPGDRLARDGRARGRERC